MYNKHAKTETTSLWSNMKNPSHIIAGGPSTFCQCTNDLIWMCVFSGAAAANSMLYSHLTASSDYWLLPNKCVSIRCQGYETSLAECVIYDKVEIDDSSSVATATCYEPSQAPKGLYVLLLFIFRIFLQPENFRVKIISSDCYLHMKKVLP